MKSVQVHIAPIVCKFFDLTAFTTHPDALETIIQQDEPFGLRVTVEFERSGAIALMPLALPIQVDFCAKPYGTSATIELGHVLIETVAGQFTYHPTLDLPVGPASLGVVPEKIYNISALLRIGAVGGPAFINGFIDDLAIQTYALDASVNAAR